MSLLLLQGKPRRSWWALSCAGLGLGVALVCAGCASPTSSTSTGKLSVVAAESPWGAVAAAVGGRYVTVRSLITDPNTDPHEYSATASSAAAVASASVVVENGLGYDHFMDQLLSTGAEVPRSRVVASDVLGVHGADANPHLWYGLERISTMAEALAKAFAKRDPEHRAAYLRQAATFDTSLSPLIATIIAIRSQRAGTPVGETERVAGYLLAEAGLDVASPPGFERSIEAGSSPSAGDTASMISLLAEHGVALLVYNLQTSSPTTENVRAEARAAQIPVVAVSETVEPVGSSFVAWQARQLEALAAALGVHP
jgi:zinc/manganese transport system substrate-binding protein